MSYADFNFYVNEFYGTALSAENFDKYASRASDYIDYITMGKSKSYDDTDDALAKACCAVAEQVASADEFSSSMSMAGGLVASETVGSHSVSFRSGAEIKASLDANMLNAAQMYLLPTGLLYRGVPCIRLIP